MLCSHRHERFLLFVWAAVLFQHVRFEIQQICKPLARDLSRLVLHSHTTERFLLLYGEALLFLLVRFEFVLHFHRHERFLLLYGKAVLCQHVRFEIQGYHVQSSAILVHLQANSVHIQCIPVVS